MKSLLSKSSLDRLLKLDDQERNRLERKGVEMGTINSPAPSAKSLCQFELDEKNKLIKAFKKFKNDASKQLEKLNKEKTQLHKKLDIQLPKFAERTEENIQLERDQTEQTLGEKSSKFEEAKSKYWESHKVLSTIKIQVNQRPLSTQFVTFYVPFMILLAFAEVFVNSLAFELFFESSQLISIIVATGVGAMLVFFAHITGSSFKRTQSKEVPVSKANTYLSMGVLNSLVVVLIFYLSKMRQAFVSITNQEEQGFGIDPDKLLSSDTPGLNEALGSPNILDALMQVNLGPEGMFLLLINVAVYVCGFVAAFVRHDTHPDYERAQKNYDKDRKELFKVRKLLDDKLANIDKKRADMYQKNKQETDISEEDLSQIDEELDELNSLISELSNRVNEIFNEKLSIFRNANINNRKKPSPEYFKEDSYKIV